MNELNVLMRWML